MKFNIDTELGKAIHRPRSKSTGEPFYNRVGETGNVYSSPTNIRGVLVSGQMTLTKTWIPPVGMKTTLLQGAVKVSGEETFGLDEVFKMKAGYESSRAEYLKAKASGNEGLIEPEIVRVTGSGFRTLIQPLVCNNIEEVVFTTELLISDNLDMDKVALSLISMRIAESYTNSKVPSDMVLYLFAKLVGIPKNEVQSRFPLLKKIMFISDLSNLYDISEDKVKALLNNNFNEEMLDKLTSTGMIGAAGYCELKPLADSLDIRDGIYELDSKLKGLKVAKFNREDNDGEANEVEDRASNEDLRIAKALEGTISNGLETSDSDAEANARLRTYYKAIENDYGKKADSLIALFKDEDLKERLLSTSGKESK
jgi:hypothetical protein